MQFLCELRKRKKEARCAARQHPLGSPRNQIAGTFTRTSLNTLPDKYFAHCHAEQWLEESISDGSETYLAYIVYGRTIDFLGKSSDFFGIDYVGTLREACVDTPLLAESVGQSWPVLAALESHQGAQGQVRWSNSWRDCYSRLRRPRVFEVGLDTLLSVLNLAHGIVCVSVLCTVC